MARGMHAMTASAEEGASWVPTGTEHARARRHDARAETNIRAKALNHPTESGLLGEALVVV